MIVKLVRPKNDSNALEFYAPNGKRNYIKTMRTLTCIQLQNTYKKAQPNFLQTTRKPKIILTLFIAVLTISFLLLSTSSASVEFYKLTTLDKMILLAVKLSRLDVSSTQLKRGFNFPFKFIYGQSVTRSRS